ncbi:hypothetical protein [Companilactobacillus versmoldensis]|uniref:HicB-like antitoxin of toxin-antitoxin system domain-containing protein n=1 Tax=Companilactobacillus versmoldensis DSM 14857 = KCTC 3814 TaxID=1423815 RepID=A0A0R1SCX5_9LACO|nr:hypothetical protein [Companilactobacillus versmoldensis]KRL66944.1 hypothetical protein FC27_GL002270 [Companilactobacillus versmoldensis DSM 14857 = KCTC 3814]
MTDTITYPAVLSRSEMDENILYNVTFPDLSSANTYGMNIRDARSNAETLLSLLLNDLKHFPESSSLIDLQKHYPNSIVSLITVKRQH